MATNGTLIEWLEPKREFGRNARRNPSQNRFRARISVPAYNDTEYVALYLDKKLYKRYVLPKHDIAQDFDFLIDEKIANNHDFLLGVIAWGKSFLPEIIFGAKNLAPFAASRQICVDLNSNEECDVDNF